MIKALLLAKWDKDAIILNIAVLVLCLEILVISIILCSLFCFLRRVYRAQRQLTALLKHFIYHTGISSIILGFAILTSTSHLYQYRHTSKILVIIIVAVVQPLAYCLYLLCFRHCSPSVTKMVNTVKSFAANPGIK